MTKLALALVAIASLTTGCASMGTRRPSGGQSLQKTAAPADPAAQVEGAFDQRADLGER